MAEPKEKKLTDKETAFISAYLVDFNATQAAIKAGYSEKTAFSIGCENLKKPYIQDAIKIEVDKILSNNRTLALRVVRECEKIAFGKISDILEFDNDGVILKSSNDIDTATIESVSFDETSTSSKEGAISTTTKKRVKQYSKEKALEILAKYTTLYTDAPQITIPINHEDEAVKALLEKHGIKTVKD